MKSTRELFEEIWPVPQGVCWDYDSKEYVPRDYKGCDEFYDSAVEWDARLDTFTRCQESMFSKEEINLFRQWFDAMQDLNPAYIEKSDCDLYRKVMERLK